MSPMEAITYTEARNRLAETLDRVAENHEPVIITRRGRQAVVMLSLEDYNAWQETEYLTRSAANAADLLQAVEEIRARRNLAKHRLIEA
ncbi:MAG: type II toxin-antitoxin system prevent-host-death family antitoxin [Sterolibacteriaceae bacterium MAG5]|nr:type II toxin-antitoxin system prevent-host-death family antitoxin [Candidatus Nitricoxidireducens bremensis]